jgi:hypothetical protein
VRRTQRRTLDPQILQHAVGLRHQRLHIQHIARLLMTPFSTVARTLSHLGLGRLRNLEPKHPMQRCEWERPGDLIRVDEYTLAHLRKVGHRMIGERHKGRSYGAGYDKVHVAVDVATRVAYVGVLEDEHKPTVISFLSKAIAWFNSQGIEGGWWRRRPRLCLQGVRQGLPHAEPLAYPQQALHAQNQRQSRAVQSDPLQGMGLGNAVPEVRTTGSLTAPLSGDL